MLNKVMLIGRLGQDPELKHILGGTAVCKFNLATSEKYTDNAGYLQERTEWHGITAWAKLAEVCAQCLHKGQLVYVEGSLRHEKYETKSGEKREHTRVNAQTVRFLTPKKVDGGGGAPSTDPAPPGPVTDNDIPF